MKDEEYLQYCLREIERKLNWEKSFSWKEPDFIKLSEIIAEASNISISPHTLKRLFGKIKYSKHYNPQHATKDALALFLGFANWEDFVADYKKKKDLNPVANQSSQNKRGISKKRGVLILSLLVVLPLAVWFLSRYPLNTTNKPADFSFGLTDSVGTVPLTVSVHYNVEKLRLDSTYIDFDFNHPVFGPQVFQLDAKRHIYNYTYQIPGYYSIDLLNNGDTLAAKKVLAMSKGWDSYINYENNQRFWLDNEIKKSDSTGYLYYSPKDLTKAGFDTNRVFYVVNRLFMEFDIDGDNFELETRFKNSKDSGGITCYDFILRLFCENNLNYIRLMQGGCSGFSGMKVGETVLDGVLENLSSFKFDIEDWNTLHVIVRYKNVQVFVNDELIYTGKYNKPNGKIVGIENVFKGAGMLDYIKIKDLDTQQVFFHGFE